MLSSETPALNFAYNIYTNGRVSDPLIIITSNVNWSVRRSRFVESLSQVSAAITKHATTGSK